jgi:hypothetical protein
MKRFREFLLNTAAIARSGKFSAPGYPKLRIVLGNTACDMDSVVSALALSWFYTIKNH